MQQIKETLLVVDDSRFQRTVLKETLRSSFELMEATSGDECLEMIERYGAEIDLVLLNLVMPGMDGFDVLRRRQLMDNFKNIPVIMLTTSDSNEFQKNAFELGADEFIVKPVDPNIALSRINNILNTKRRIQALLKQQDQLRELAQIDAMTNLFHKTISEQLITQELISTPKQHHALFVIDIDNFKAVNDVYGHKVGDHIITVIAGAISSHFSETDFIGRIGGDEFVVLMRNIDSKETARKKAEELIQLIKQKENLSIPENITLSIGLAFSDEMDNKYADLFNKADHALYVSKKAGKCCYSEYGVITERDSFSHTVLVWTSSHSIGSILEFVFHHPVHLECVSTLEEARKAFITAETPILCMYVDVSESSDAGIGMWNCLKKEDWLNDFPLIAICGEGELQQMRYAIQSNLITDLLLAPLDAETISRRANAVLRKETEETL